MAVRKLMSPFNAAGLLGLALTAAIAVTSGCSEAPREEGKPRATGPAVIELSLPKRIGERDVPLRRPVVQFDHALHTEKLAQQGCEACHPATAEAARSARPSGTTEGRALEFDLAGSQKTSDRDALMNFYHELCVNCHRDRAAAGHKSGAVACGECHAEGPSAVAVHQAMVFDYSLHDRHVQASEDRCEDCHHVERNQATEELVHRSDEEESCRGCHGAQEQDGRPPLRTAVHQDCVNCHLERAAKGGEAGPTECAGCHDAARQGGIKPADGWPRLEIGQSDTMWLRAAGAMSNLVPFDHAAHEQRTTSCSGCHHQRLKACSECHALTGSSDGGGVTLEDAYHRASAPHSCVGCHDQQTKTKDCSGCHSAMAAPPGEAACVRCHSGPPAAGGAPTTAVKLPAVDWAPLPEVGDDFPETVLIDVLAAEYAPSTLPHRQIVAALDEMARSSALATRFHGSVDVLCAGCHHHSPLGTRPPPCRSCHERAAHPTRDMPGLRAAYHRQCLGCHRQMAIEPQATEPKGCGKGCHEKASKEDKP